MARGPGIANAAAPKGSPMAAHQLLQDSIMSPNTGVASPCPRSEARCGRKHRLRSTAAGCHHLTWAAMTSRAGDGFEVATSSLDSGKFDD